MDAAAQRVYDELIQSVDDPYGDVATFVGALGDELLQDLEDLVRDGPNGETGWSVVLDLNRIADEGLDYIGQFVGVRFYGDMDAVQKRALVAAKAGWQRGTPAAIIAAAQATLTGTKQVNIIERNGDPYQLTVSTKTSETPDPVATLQALVSQKPAGIVLSYQNLDGQTYQDVFSGFATYSVVFTTFTNYQNLLFNNQVVVPIPQQGDFGDGTFGTGKFGG